ncbi:CRAL/TRIO domain-containing protein [Ramicandelaber brevisporus]|nr:CRAL/TRIO domain-containing protein [Ramicandelaber brevisporus]
MPPPPQMVPNYEGHLYHLTPEQTKTLHQFRVMQVKKALADAAKPLPPDPNPLDASMPVFEEFAFRPRNFRQGMHCFAHFDHPDSLLLRILRARKWNLQKAEDMLEELYKWRLDFDVAEVMYSGERSLKRSILEKGMTYVTGLDRLGRPVFYVRVKLNSPRDQTLEEMQRFLVYTMETARLLLHHPVEKACILFDMTDFSLSNMDLPFVKFLIKCLEAYYPESLGILVIYNAPWVFSGVWRIISPLLDPVVAAKIQFMSKPAEIQEVVDPKYLPKHMGGTDIEEFSYLAPDANADHDDDSHMKNAPEDRLKAFERRRDAIRAFEEISIKLDDAYDKLYKNDTPGSKPGDNADEETKQTVKNLDEKREEVVKELQASAIDVDYYIRSRTFYHRYGIIDRYRSPPNFDSTANGKA